MRVCIYLRSAFPDQTELEDQRQRCLSYAAQNGHDVVAVYEDYGKSGMDHNRLGLQAMLEAAKTGSFDGLIVDRLYRLSRDWDLADRIDLLHQYNVPLIVVDTQSRFPDDHSQNTLAEVLREVKKAHTS